MSNAQTMTASGAMLDILEPVLSDPPMPEDIWLGLSRIHRFGSQLPAEFEYTVAQHSLLCEWIARQMFGDSLRHLSCLLHDAAEAFIGDIPTPLKHALRVPLDNEAVSAEGRRLTSIEDVEERLLEYLVRHVLCCPDVLPYFGSDYYTRLVDFYAFVIEVRSFWPKKKWPEFYEEDDARLAESTGGMVFSDLYLRGIPQDIRGKFDTQTNMDLLSQAFRKYHPPS